MSELFDRFRSALADRYAIDREIGSGGMAIVYLAEDLKHGRQVALKVLRPELALTLGPDRFLSEIQITARLDHPHILPLLDSGEAKGFLYFVMPYVEGETLRDRIEREGALPVDDVKRITREVASALSYAHDRGVVHRDIKPGNILLHSGHARLADFGIAHAVGEAGGERLTATGLSLGTPAYMSPEQAAGQQDIDARSDTYSLACVTYEMLAGQPPFTGTGRAVLAQHVTEVAPSVSTLRPDAGSELESALAKALEKIPDDRQASTAEFASNLETEASLRRSRGGRRWAVALGVLALVLAGAWALLGDRFEIRPSETPDDVAPTLAVLPFTVSGTGTEGLGQSAVSALSTSLDGAAGYEAIATTTVVAEWERAASGGRALSHEEALDVARRAGAGYAVVGSAAAAGASVRLAAEMYDVDTGTRIADATSEGPPNSLVALLDALAFDLVMSMWEGGAVDLPSMNLDLITTGSLDALKAYIDGDMARQLLEFDRAVEAWTRATEADSTFRQAYWRIRDGTWYTGMGTLQRMPIDRWAARRLWALSDSTTPPLGGVEALEWYRAYLLENPDDSDAWLRLANIAENHSTREEARAAFGRAIDLEPGSLFYRAEMAKNYASVQDDSAATAYWLDQVEEARTTLYVREMQVQFDAAYGDSVTRAELAASFDTIPRELLANLHRVLANTRQADLFMAWADARSARRLEFGGEDEGFPLYRKAHYAGFARGRLGEAAALMRDSLVTDDWRAIYAMHAWLQDLPLSEELQRSLDADYAAGGWPGFPAADERRWEDLAAEVTRSRLRADTLRREGNEFGAGINESRSVLLQAYGHWRSGDLEAAVALLEPLDALGDYTVFRRWWLGQLHLELSHPQDALEYLGSGWSGQYPWAISLYYAGQAHQMLGQDEEAVAAYAEFLEYWKDADSEVRHFAADAGARVKSLAGSGSP